jgi:hypothetical protein
MKQILKRYNGQLNWEIKQFSPRSKFVYRLTLLALALSTTYILSLFDRGKYTDQHYGLLFFLSWILYYLAVRTQKTLSRKIIFWIISFVIVAAAYLGLGY